MRATPPRPKRRLGQNFLVHPGLAERLVASLPLEPEDTVIELGPGRGILTRPLARRCRRVRALELDPEAVAFLREELKGLPNVEVIPGDMLSYPLEGLTDGGKGGLKVVGNLPYNVSTPLLLRLVEMRREMAWAGLMFQREVAQRIASPPGTRAYGTISVLTQYAATVRPILDLSPGSFYPRPKVWSSFLILQFRPPSKEVESFELFREVVHAAFRHRRKKLINSMRGLRGYSSEQLLYALSQAKIDTRYRGEELSVEQFVILTNILAKMAKKG